MNPTSKLMIWWIEVIRLDGSGEGSQLSLLRNRTGVIVPQPCPLFCQMADVLVQSVLDCCLPGLSSTQELPDPQVAWVSVLGFCFVSIAIELIGVRNVVEYKDLELLQVGFCNRTSVIIYWYFFSTLDAKLLILVQHHRRRKHCV